MQYKKALVVAAHPDDEMLGCGGALARLIAGGAKASILLLGEGPLARSGFQEKEREKEAMHSALEAAALLEIEDVHFTSLPDNQFDTVPFLEIVKKIESIARDLEPDIVLTHHAGDLNLDHVITHRAVMTAFRPLPGVKPCTVAGFEIPSSTEYLSPTTGPAFQPNMYIDISHFLDTKIKLLHAYDSEMRPWPHPRSYRGVQHLAHLRGCHCGVDAAEAFILYRMML